MSTTTHTGRPYGQWFKSSYSGGSGTECVECAPTENAVLVRDSKNDGRSILVRRSAWQAFAGALRGGWQKG